MAFNRCDAGLVGCRLRVLATSNRSASLEVSRFIQRAIKLLVRSCPMISCSLTNSAMNVRVRVQSSSCTLPISCMVWRWRAWMCTKISCVVSITCCLGRTLPPEGTSLLPSASTLRDFPGADTSIGDASAPSDLSSCCSATCLASRRCQSVPCIKGRMRSETMFQWSLDGGLRFTAIF